MHETLPEVHTKTYDLLADEYEQRVQALRPVTEYALSLLTRELEPGSRILDVGCAVGYTLEIFRDHGMNPEGIELSPAMIAYAQQRNPATPITQGDFFTEPYPEQSFDAVCLYAFIHLFPKDVALQGLTKTARILRPGGFAFLSTTKSLTSSEGFEQKIDYTATAHRFRKRWTQPEFEEAIQGSGFDITYHEDLTDDFGKVWMDYVVQKQV